MFKKKYIIWFSSIIFLLIVSFGIELKGQESDIFDTTYTENQFKVVDSTASSPKNNDDTIYNIQNLYDDYHEELLDDESYKSVSWETSDDYEKIKPDRPNSTSINKIPDPSVVDYNTTPLSSFNNTVLKYNKSSFSDNIKAYNKSFLDVLHAKVTILNPVDRYKSKERELRDIWKLYVVFGLILMTVIISCFFDRELKLITASLFNNRVFSLVMRDFTLLGSKFWLFSYVFIDFVLGFLFYFFFRDFIKYDSLRLYFLCVAGVSLFILMKTIILRLLGILLSERYMMLNYIDTMYITFASLSIILVPFLFLNTLSIGKIHSTIYFICIALFLLSFAYQYIRAGIYIFMNFEFSLTYFIIYLCMVEVLPLVLMYKLFLGNF